MNIKPREFIELLANKIKERKDFPVLPSLTIAQACLESGYGVKSFYNNIFGIKCHDPNKYAGCRLGTTAEFIDGSMQFNLRLAFQTYEDIADSLDDYSRLMNVTRYQPVRISKDFFVATNQIRLAGYATSPRYTENLRSVIIHHKLYEYDWKRDPEMWISHNFQWKEMFSNIKIGHRTYQRIIEPYEEYWENAFEVARQWQIARDHYKIPFVVNSAFRPPHYNAVVNGAIQSQHITCSAIDVIKWRGYNQREFDNFCRSRRILNGLGWGRNFTHGDIRNNIARWNY